jgi:hypothetical protein
LRFVDRTNGGIQDNHENGHKPMNNNPLHEDARCFYATSGFI